MARHFVSTVGLFLLLYLTAPQRLLATDRPPNFVVIFIDDMGYGDLGCYGGKRAPTPRLDRMAAEGMRFTNFCSAAAVCSSSRASLLTGCYPQRVSILGALAPQARIGIHQQEILLPQLLKTHGYATAIFGKWHLGHLPQFLPTKHGFDEYFGLPYSNDMGPAGPLSNAPDLPLMEGDKTIAVNPEMSQLTTWYTEHAIDFIDRHKQTPFFLYVPHSMVHVPLDVSDKFLGKSGTGLYGDVLMEVDWSVGQILDALTRNGLDAQTFVLFTADNGPWLPYGDHGGTAGPLRGEKGTTWEGGHREPCIARWPSKIPAGRTCKEFCTTMDILPTIAKLAGTEAPQDRVIDGHDIWPLLSARPEAKSPYDVFYYYWLADLEAVRSGPWKLVLPHKYRSMVGPPGTNGKHAGEGQSETSLALFNLDEDLSESINVAQAHPEVVARLQTLAEKAREDLGDGLTKRKGKNVRPHGES